jgi:hypothetical protein
MKNRTRGTYVFSGMLLANSTPHVIVAISGQKGMTPFGRDSSPRINGLWGAVNAISGLLLILRTNRRPDAAHEPRSRLLPILVGSLVWSAFMVTFEWIAHARE